MSLVLNPASGPLKKPTKADRPKKTPKPKRPAVKTHRALEKLADRHFSRYIRLRDSQFVNGIWVGTCITCTKTGGVAWHDEAGKLRFNVGWDNGHFVSRGHKIVRYDERNCNLQCSYRCNKMRSGEYQKYKQAVREKYGDEIPEELEQLAKDSPTYRHTKAELEKIISDSKEQVKFYLNN